MKLLEINQTCYKSDKILNSFYFALCYHVKRNDQTERVVDVWLKSENALNHRGS